MAINPNILLQTRVADAVTPLSQGLASGERMRNAPVRNQLLQAQTQGAELSNQAAEQKMTRQQAEFMLKDAAIDAIKIKELAQTDPMRAQVAIAQRIKKIQDRGGDPSDTLGLRQAFTEGNMDVFNSELDAVINGAQQAGLLNAPDSAGGGGGIGTYNPRDYTTESWSQFTQTKDPGVLKRYESSRTVDIGGVPHVFDPATRSMQPVSIGDKNVTTADVAESRAGIKSAEKTAEVTAETKGATDKAFMQRIGQEGADVYSNLQKAAQNASEFIPRLESIRDLAGKVETGTGAEIKLAAKKALGIESADMEELNAKLGELAQDILNQQTGTKTDFDFQNAVRQSAALGKTPEANVRLINALIDRQKQAVNFADQAKKAYDSGGVRAVLDMRYKPPGGQSGSKDFDLEYDPATGTFK